MSIRDLIYGVAINGRTVACGESQRIVNPQKWRKCAVMTNQWRLIDGIELYDMYTDAGQSNDVAGQYPEVVQRLRSDYDASGMMF